MEKGKGMKTWRALVSRTIAAGLALAAVGFLAGCDDGESGGGHLDAAVAEQAYARGNGVAWLENKGSDFWTIDRVSFGGGANGTSAGTYELAPGHYVLSVSATADPWKDQWARTHYDTKASRSVGLDVVAGQSVHVVMDSTGAGNEFSLVVAP